MKNGNGTTKDTKSTKGRNGSWMRFLFGSKLIAQSSQLFFVPFVVNLF
jgi:hypothetical protein